MDKFSKVHAKPLHWKWQNNHWKSKEDLNKKKKKDVYNIYGLEGSVLLRYRYSV